MPMLVAFVLMVLWLLGLLTGSTLGGLVHALMLAAVVILLVGLLQHSARRFEP